MTFIFKFIYWISQLQATKKLSELEWGQDKKLWIHFEHVQVKKLLPVNN